MLLGGTTFAAAFAISSSLKTARRIEALSVRGTH
jgi:hypothetical protein